MSTPRLGQFSRQVVEILPLLFREFAKREDNPLTRGKISFPQMVVLDYLSRQGRVQMNEIAAILSIRMSSATVLVDRLIREKMVTRSRDERDRRVVWAAATPKGRRVVSQILEQKRKSIEGIFGVLTAKERAHYLKALLKVKMHLLSAPPPA